MPRVTVAECRVILPDVTELKDPEIQAAIDSATLLVDRVAGYELDFTDDELSKIELYLSCHYAATTENTLSVKSEKDECANLSLVYGFEFGKGIEGTKFGQDANMLSYGVLTELSKTPIVTHAIGCL